jgi:hypothetical protein
MKTRLSTFAAVLLVISVAPNARAHWVVVQGAPPMDASTPNPAPAPPASPAAEAPPPAAEPAGPSPPPASSDSALIPLPPPAEAPPSPLQVAAAAAPPPAATAAQGGGPGPVERLPPSAYPEEYTRGLYGGSMWMTFHGAQWPYYPRTGIGVSGYGWIDNSFQQINVGEPSSSFDRTRDYLQQGRLLLRVTPTYSSGDFFVQAQAEIVANKDQSEAQPRVIDADDAWVRLGRWAKWDLMFGRFEAWEIYHRGMGLDINTQERLGAFDANSSPPDIYGATYLFDRPARSGNVAAHLYPYRFLRVELLAQYGGLGANNEIGGRPAVIYDIGWLKLKAAAEYQWLTPHTEGDKTEQRNRGFAGSAQFVFTTYVEGGISYGYANNRVFDQNGNLDTSRTAELSSVGLFANARPVDIIGALARRPWHNDMLIGAGINYVAFANEHYNANAGGFSDFFTNTQGFVAIQYLIQKQLFVKLVGAYARSHFEKAFATVPDYNDTMFSARLRVLYLF